MPEEIDIRKRYMTRGRAKVFQLERREDGYLYGIIDGAGWCIWRSNGSMLPNEEHDFDLTPAQRSCPPSTKRRISRRKKDEQ